MELYKKIITRFPIAGISYVFAYGSGVKQQIGYESIEKQQNNIIDLIICVRDAQGWHAENIQRHPSHYSVLRHLGSNFVRNYQERFGAGVYFNTLVPLEDIGVTIKYGVVSQEELLEDLLKWRHIYLAGRLHKPVQDIVEPIDNRRQISEALHKNRLAAFQTSLLLLPERFSAFELFCTIANLSYKGDFRMIFGENKQKVRNIVQAQEGDFLQLYQTVMQQLTTYVAVDLKGKKLGANESVVLFEQDKSQSAIEYHLRQLPEQLRKRIVRNAAFRGNYIDIIEHLAMASNLRETVQVSVNDIVWRSSITQSLKNIPSAGISKSILYSYQKALKTFT